MIYRKLIKNNLPYLLITGLGLFMFQGIFSRGFMSGYDNSLHYYDAHYLINILIPRYHWISGWDMQHMAGLPILVDYYQIPHLLIAILNQVTRLPLNISYKIMVLLSYISLGTAFYKISSYRFGKAASFLATLCLMLQKDIYLERILNGVWNNYFALGLFFIFFHILDKEINGMTLKKGALLGLILGLIVLTHLFVAVFAFSLLFIYGFPYLSDAFKTRGSLKKIFIYGLIPTFAFMISSYYLYGFIVSRGYFTSYPIKDIATGLRWAVKSFFGPMERMDSMSALMINLPVILRIIFSFSGVYIFLRREKESDVKRFLNCVTVFIFISLILFSDMLPNTFSGWRKIPFVGTLQTNRFLIYIHLGAYLFAAYGMARFLESFRIKRRTLLFGAVLSLLLVSASFHYIYLASERSRTLEQSPQMADIFKMWDWIDKNIPAAESRVVYQDTIGNSSDPILKRSGVFALAGIFTKVAQIGTSRAASPFPQEKYMRNDQGNIFGEKVDEMSAESIKGMMENFNAGYIVGVEPNLKNKLDGSQLFFKEREFGPFNVYRLKGFSPAWISFEKDASYKTLLLDNQDLVFYIWNGSVDNKANIKVAYHPLWKAWINGQPVKIEQGKYGLMKISLPKEGSYRLELSFNSFNLFWTSISSIGVVIGLIIIWGVRGR
ncbi:MAG: hypothetical protein A2987_01730 [Omnitrophica bacterium RIFCSPLOWO2_01_FULL_45_10]|nr:MAG: hypothetical protein A2987_01730 [Omnitrophica bacterium RIFCSPLOWO2_01_FULL_45_10]